MSRLGPFSSYEFATEIQRRADINRRVLTGKLAEFVEFYTRPAQQLSLHSAHVM